MNRVGGEDGILFDGASFVVHGKKVLAQLDSFEEGVRTLELPRRSSTLPRKGPLPHGRRDSQEAIFCPYLNFSQTPPTIQALEDGECAEVLKALAFGIQEYASKCRLRKFLVALSGGIDSALTATIVQNSPSEKGNP